MLTAQLYLPWLVLLAATQGTRLDRLPALARLLTRSAKERLAAADFDALLWAELGVPDTDAAPVAALTLLADGGEPRDAYWLRADPVHLLADRGGLILDASGPLHLTEAEAQQLTRTLNAHFSADGFELVAAFPERWYLRLAEPADVHTTPPALAAGRSIDGLLPQGPQALAWHRRINEAQMLLHEHPVNAAREARGALPVNSLWLWGGGKLPRCPTHRATPARIWADAPLGRGIARCDGMPVDPVPASAAEWLATPQEGEHCFIIGDPDQAPPRDPTPEEQLQHLETSWFAPLLDALRRGRVQRIRLATWESGQGLSFVVTRADLWKLWRRNAGLPVRQ